MKRYLLVSLLALATVAADSAATAQPAAANPPRNHFGLSYRMGFNISGKFENLGGFSALTIPGPAQSGIDHFYDNGYNRVDSTGNAPLPGTTEGVTTYWGYRGDPGQVTAGNQAVVMSSSSSAADVATDDLGDDPQHGLELSYNHIFGRSGNVYWGLEAALGYTDLTLHNGSTLLGSVTRMNDSYSLGGVLPPQAAPPAWAYEGLPTGPGTLLGDTPTRMPSTIIPGGATITGSRNFDADLYGVRLGPYVHIPISQRFFATMSGGLAIVSVNSDFRYQETVTIPGVGVQSRSGSGTESDVLFGGYFSSNLYFALTQSANLFAGFQYQNVSDYTHKLDGKKATLDLGSSLFLTLGLGYSF